MITILPHDSTKELARFSHLKQYARISDRLHAVRLAREGRTGAEISAALGRSPRWVFAWCQRYNEQGVEGLFDRPRSGQPKRLDDAGREKLKGLVDEGPDLERDGVSTWTGEAVRALVAREFGVDYSLSQIYNLAARLGFSWITPRPKHPESDPDEQKRWKNEQFPSRSRKSKRRTRKRKSSAGSATNRVSGKKA